ncbi:MAG: hypothetical protein GY941_27345 [Planctomycetes bacterium]|nr:hypothetical protein [Planctomycetota bacterium]
MKSIVTDKPVPDEKPFPKLMVNPTSNVIILMENARFGIIVGNPTKSCPFGHCNDWYIKDLTDYTGTVTLSND